MYSLPNVNLANRTLKSTHFVTFSISCQEYYITIGISHLLLLLPKQVSENLGLPMLRSLDLDQSQLPSIINF